MHTWYLEIIVPFYIVYVAVFMAVKNTENDWKKVLEYLVVTLGCISVILYLIPEINAYDKFYYLPFRFFEFMIGAVVALLPVRVQSVSDKVKYNV